MVGNTKISQLSGRRRWGLGAHMRALRLGAFVNWDAVYRRACWYIVDLLRRAPNFATLSLFFETPHLSPSEVWDLLKAANERNGVLIGRRALSESTVDKRILSFHADGLLARCVGSESTGGEHTRYDLTRLGAGLVAAVSPVGDFALSHWDQFVRATRVRHMGEPDVPEVCAPVAPSPVPPDAYARRLATGMAFSVLRGRWAFACLVYCADGPISSAVMRETMNASMSAIPDFAQRVLHQEPQYDQLRRLERKGLLERVEQRRRGRRPQVLYQLTPLGAGLLGALWEATPWAIENDHLLWPIVQRQQHWFDDE